MESDAPIAKAQRLLAARFGLPYTSHMQDWEWEVADSARFSEFLEAYSDASLSDDERVCLMEILIQCVEDMETQTSHESTWSKIEPFLRKNSGLHMESIDYWSCGDEKNEQHMFRVSLKIRALRNHSPTSGPASN